MESKTFAILIFIINNINWSTSYVQYARFKSERSESFRKKKSIHNKSGEKEERGEEQISCNKRESLNTKQSLSLEKGGFISDVKWMLEYNQNGLMQLILYSIHLIILAIQVFISILYTFFPTTRDPTTNEYVNPWLRYAERLAITDFIHNFDQKGRFNQLLGIVALQCLILRLRAFYSRLKTAKINKYQYEKINVVDLEFGYVSEIRNSFSDLLRAAEAFNHSCNLEGSLPRSISKRNADLDSNFRYLSKMDKIYYHNLIDFNDCFEKLHLFDAYNKEIEAIDKKLLADADGNCSLDNCDKVKQTWLQYVFSINLPNKIAYIAKPEQRLDLDHGIFLNYIFTVNTTMAAVVMFGSCLAISCVSLKYWNGVSLIEFVFGVMRTNLTLVLVILNVYDSGLLAFCSVLFLSRSRKIVKLLKKQLNIYQRHMRQLSAIDFNEKSYINFKAQAIKLPEIKSGFKRTIEDLIAIPGHPNERSLSQNRHIEFSRRRERESIISADCTINDRDRIGDLIAIYRRSLGQSCVDSFNENINHLLDLVEVLQFEFSDHKKFFTLLLDVNIIFGTIGSALSLGVLIGKTDTIGFCLALFAGFGYLLPMVSSLLIGASSEAALIGVYRHLRPLLADELGFLQANNEKRLFKICQNLAVSQNRSFVILGNFSLSFGSLASILVWIITCTTIFQRFVY